MWPVAVQSKENLYDEPYRRMDGWMDGRTDVDLGGTRRTGGGCRRDKESDQEKIVSSRFVREMTLCVLLQHSRHSAC